MEVPFLGPPSWADPMGPLRAPSGATGAPVSEDNESTETLLYVWGPDPLWGAGAAATTAAAANSGAGGSKDGKGPPPFGGPQLMCHSGGGAPEKGPGRGPLKTELETLTRPNKGRRGSHGSAATEAAAAGAAGEPLLPIRGPLRLSVSSVSAGDRHALLLLDTGISI